MSNTLAGRTALITGSVSGIGLAIAKAFAANGARLVLHGLATAEQGEKAIQAVRAAGAADACFFDHDLRDPDAIADLMTAANAWGPIDVLVNNAGVQKTTSIADASADIWNLVIAVNLSACFHTMHHALPGMAERGYGRVINIASVHGLVASKDKSPYVASKFGLVGMSKVAALEYAAVGSRDTGGVTVNCICPGFTETALIEPQVQARAELHGGDRDAGVADLLSEKQPSQRMTDPSDLAELAVWLCAKAAHNINGTSIPVDGGWTAQ